jgi:hypothetical protein
MTQGTRVQRARALRDELWSALDDPQGQSLTNKVLARFERDALAYSDILEWSLSEDLRGVEVARFSYAFPGYPNAPDEVARSVLSWTRTQSPAAERAARSLMRAARHPAVEQVLLGYAHGGGARRRIKLYLQFRGAAGNAALELARALLGTQRTTSSDALPLHLLGLDVGQDGLSGAKLYFVEQQRGPRFEAWSRALANTLRIHRLQGPDDACFQEPTEIDFSLPDNDLSFEELAASPVMASFARSLERFGALATRFGLRARRVSLALSGPAKLNLYYVLDESDARTGTSSSVPYISA